MKLTSEQKRELERLIASGDKIGAIKQFRNMADVGLAEAKAFIESMEGGGHRSSAHVTEPRNLRQAEAAALAAIRQGDFVEAIKLYRIQTGIGLKEAKEAVDTLLVVDRTDGRVNAKLARMVQNLLKAGQRDAAITALMTQSGLDETEAMTLVRAMPNVALRVSVMQGGCLRIFGAIVLVVLAWAILSALGEF